MKLKWNYFICLFISLFIIGIMCISYKEDNTYDTDNNLVSEKHYLNFDFDRVNLDKVFTPNDNAHYSNDLIDFISNWLNLKIDNWHSQLITYMLYVFLCTFIIFNFSLIPYCYYRLWNWILKDKTTNMKV